MKICSKKCIVEPKSYTAEIHEVFIAKTHTKKVKIGSFIKAGIRIRNRIQSLTSGSGSDQKGPDPTGSATLHLSMDYMLHTVFKHNIFKIC
jgi:hypothetical protein